MKKIESIETVGEIKETLPKNEVYIAKFPLGGINGRIETGQEVKEGDLHCTLAYALMIGAIEVK